MVTVTDLPALDKGDSAANRPQPPSPEANPQFLATVYRALDAMVARRDVFAGHLADIGRNYAEHLYGPAVDQLLDNLYAELLGGLDDARDSLTATRRALKASQRRAAKALADAETLVA